MTTVLQMNLPWISLRPKLAPTNGDGLIEYRKAFEDFRLQLKYNEVCAHPPTPPPPHQPQQPTHAKTHDDDVRVT